MLAKKLEIFRLSKDGSLQRHLVCLGGRVSVFRANRDELLEEFRVALQGRVPVQQFRILLDEKPFVSADHFLIGFNEKFEPRDDKTVRDYLLESGVVEAELSSLLHEYGLAGLESAKIFELGASQQRVLRLLVATASAHGRIVILNDPFEGLQTELQESLAQRVAEFSYQNTAIVVVSRLSHRPESWIENPVISRVQLERPRRETIGAGSVLEPEGRLDHLDIGRRPSVGPAKTLTTAPTSAQDATAAEPNKRAATWVSGAREALAKASSVRVPDGPEEGAPSVSVSGIRHATTGVSQQKSRKKQEVKSEQERFWSIGLACGYIVVIAALAWQMRGAAVKPPAPVVAPPKLTPRPTPAPEVPLAGFQALPQVIQSQVLLAFRDPDTLLRSIPVNLKRKTPETPKKSPPQEMRSVEPPPPPEEPPPFRIGGSPDQPYSNPQGATAEDIERRREEIRQRLLQAIMQRRQQLAEQAAAGGN